ncbi:MAG: HU family DNA-binding protein [Kiritimatiellia bacterium]
MTKRDLVVRISQETGLTQEDVFTILQKILNYITEAMVKGERVEFRDFGVFEVCLRRPRVGRNPNKPEITVPIPARHTVRFKPGKQMEALVLKSHGQVQAPQG